MAELCENCRKRPATRTWGDALALSHGGGQRWCEPCVLNAQIAHAEKRAAALPKLRRRLAQLIKEDDSAGA